jgi:CBS domain containing-hemolysin-like protein
MLGIPLIYASAKLMTPLLWVVGLISKGCNYVLSGKETESNIYLSLEELQKILEEHTDEAGSVSESDEFSAIAANIFSLRTKDLKQVMEPIKLVPSLAAAATVQEAARFLKEKGVEFIPLYNRDITNIIGIATARDLIRASDTHKVRDYCSPPWFVPETASLMQILKQFRTNNESLAIILNHHGQAIGLITLDDVLAEIMGKLSYPSNHGASHPIAPKKTQVMLIEKTIPGEMLVGEFNKQFGVEIDKDESLTLSELIERTHGHHPEKGESIYIAPFEFTVKETSLVDIKSVSVNSKN